MFIRLTINLHAGTKLDSCLLLDCVRVFSYYYHDDDDYYYYFTPFIYTEAVPKIKKGFSRVTKIIKVGYMT